MQPYATDVRASSVAPNQKGQPRRAKRAAREVLQAPSAESTAPEFKGRL